MDRINSSVPGRISRSTSDERPVNIKRKRDDRAQPRLTNSHAESHVEGGNQRRVQQEHFSKFRRQQIDFKQFSRDPTGLKHSPATPSASRPAQRRSLSPSEAKVLIPEPETPKVTYRFKKPSFQDGEEICYSQRIEVVPPASSISGDKTSSAAALDNDSEIIDLTSPTSDSFEMESLQGEEALHSTSNKKPESPLADERLDEEGRPLSPVNFA